ncbi:hypothetical protein HJC23_008208 [Cyclotella cryptica]|uniref:Uncharacterized protein n=1 Tax=Cyclotella cryptica TaxID=29204 RepID=A0ABD3NWZ7_9STRA
MGFNMPSELVSKTYVHAASAILSDTTTTPGEATFITDAIKAFNKARDNEIASPQTKYENFNNAPIPNAIDPVAPVQNHIMFQVMQTNIVRPRRSSVRNNTSADESCPDVEVRNDASCPDDEVQNDENRRDEDSANPDITEVYSLKWLTKAEKGMRRMRCKGSWL